MTRVPVTIEVAKETHELGEGLAAFLGAVKAALADGWQVGQDVPALITAALADLVPAMNGAEKIQAEFLTDPVAGANAVYVTGQAVVAAMLEKK